MALRSARRFRRWIPAAALLFLAAVFRFPALESSPPSLFRDELEKGYTAWELASTGRYGRLSMAPGGRVAPSEFMPFFIDVYGVRTSAVYQWLSAPVVAIAGLNAASTRFVAAFAGTLTVLFLFLWVRRVWGPKVALWSAFWLALCPWHVVFSRWAQQGITEPLWLILALLCFQVGRSPRAGARSRALWWIGTGFFAGLAFYAYDIGRLFVPLWVAALVASHSGTFLRRWKMLLPGAAVFLVIALPVTMVALGAEGSARFNRISVFGQTSSLPAALLLFVENWIRHFDPRFLFLSGDANPRHQLPGLGVLFLVQAPLILLGLAWLARRRRPMDWFLVAWIALYPVCASLTVEGIPHALRSIVGIPAWAIATGIGTAVLFRLIAGMKRPESTRRLAGALVALALAAPTALGLSRAVYRHWPATSALEFEWPAEQVTRALLDTRGEGAKTGNGDARSGDAGTLWLSGYVAYAPHRLLFHGRVDPREWQSKGLDALPARMLPPGPLDAVWPGVGEGDRLGLLTPDLTAIRPSMYRVVAPVIFPAELGGENTPVGAVVGKAR